ncbi:ATPase ATP-binding domain-containing protein [Fusarium heterosporum]|uniref:histidine kinase n=1 Tax=Fusarium heterosporum TaxID=42747 RepID=A0A8H5TF98_FUSHE|nr:ATPase ATP-binding domain-containing protein [Fusarium heterosporum]
MSRPAHRQMEFARERETFRYDPTLIASSIPNSPTNLIPSYKLKTSSDATLTAFCQLAALRLSSSRSLISLFDRSSQYVVAEATPNTSLQSRSPLKDDQGLWLCGTHFPRSFGVCERAIISPALGPLPVPQGTEPPLTIINDLANDNTLCGRPYCIGWPHHRFYAGAPLITPRGIVIGVLCVFDSEPRSGLDESSEGILRDIAQSVIAHLEERRVSERYRQADRVTRGIRRFFHGRNTKSDMKNDRLLASEPRLRTPGTEFSPQFHYSSDNRHRGDRLVSTCATAADIMRDALEVDGLLLLDASPSHLSAGTDNAPNPSVNSDNPCPVLGSSVTAEAKQGGDSYFGHSTLYASTLKKLLHHYPRGTIWNFHDVESDASDALSDDSSDVYDSSIPEEIDESDACTAEAPEMGFTPGQLQTRQELRKAVSRLLPGATNVAFFPMWNAQKRRWFAGGFAYSDKSSRVFSPKRELSYLRALGSVLMAEVSFIKEREVELSKLDVLDSISHELRSPLHGIFFGASILRGRDLIPSQEDALLSIEACSRTLLDTIDQILDWSKINHFTSSLTKGPDYTYTKVDNRALRISRNNSVEAGMMSIASDADLPSLVEDVAESVHVGHEFQKLSLGHSETATSNKDPVRFVVHFEPGENWKFHVQPGAIRRIIMNILGNAIRFTSSGSVYIKMEQSETEDPTVRLVRLIIADTGCGMTRDFLTNDLFSPFTQQNMMNAGTGLGLSIVRRIAQALGGTVDVRSAISVGTTVRVSLPLKLSEQILGDTTEPVSDDDEAANVVGSKVSLIGFHDLQEQSLDSPLLQTPLSEKQNMLSVCQDWLGMQVIQPSKTQTPHVLLCDDLSLEEARVFSQGHDSIPIVVVCPNAVLARKAEAAGSRRDVSYEQSVYFTHQPIGPRKLALILSKAVKSGVMALRLTLTHPPPTSETHDLIPTQIAPPTPPHNETESALSSNPFDHAIVTVARLPRSPLATPSEKPDPISDDTKNDTFLLVDDNPINLKMLIMFMKKLRLQYTTATDGKQAVEKYKENPKRFRCIFMDISMPVMNGFEATRAIRASEVESDIPRCSIFALTGLASKDAQQEALLSGIDLFLTKPIQLAEIKSILELKGLL